MIVFQLCFNISIISCHCILYPCSIFLIVSSHRISRQDQDIPVQLGLGLGIISSLWSGLSWDYPRISHQDIPVQLGLGILCSLWSGIFWVYPKISHRDIPVQLGLRILCSLWSRLSWDYPGISCWDIPVQLGLLLHGFLPICRGTNCGTDSSGIISGHSAKYIVLDWGFDAPCCKRSTRRLCKDYLGYPTNGTTYILVWCWMCNNPGIILGDTNATCVFPGIFPCTSTCLLYPMNSAYWDRICEAK